MGIARGIIGLGRIASDPLALTRLDDAQALELELGGILRLDDLGVTDNQLAVPGDLDLAQGDVRRHLRRRIISQGEQRQERGAVCS